MKNTVKITKRSRCSSWSCCVPGFENALRRIRSGKIVEDEHHKHIYESSGKFVYRCQEDGFDFAYKTQNGKKPWRYIFAPSLPAREVMHYNILAEIGIPIPEVYAVGDTRSCFILKESFLITEFLDNTIDGRIFMRGGKFRTGYEALCMEFCRKHLLLLAKLHDAGLYHKAFHPRNLLFRGDSPENMEVFWIDVARLRKASDLRRAVIVDLHTFFRDMLLPEKETLELINFYTGAVKKPVFTSPEKLTAELINFKRRMFSKKKYRIFE